MSQPIPRVTDTTVPQPVSQVSTPATTSRPRSIFSRDVLFSYASPPLFLEVIRKLMTSIGNCLYACSRWMVQFIFRESGSNPTLLAEWNRVVYKLYDNPQLSERIRDQLRSGGTSADHLVQAASKTGIHPPFDHILVHPIQAENVNPFAIAYPFLSKQAKDGTFNSHYTLILLYGDRTQQQTENYIQQMKRACEQDKHPIDNAVFFTLNVNEYRILSRDHMPYCLQRLFREKEQLNQMEPHVARLDQLSGTMRRQQ